MEILLQAPVLSKLKASGASAPSSAGSRDGGVVIAAIAARSPIEGLWAPVEALSRAGVHVQAVVDCGAAFPALGVAVIVTPEELALPAAYNLAIAECSADLICFAPADAPPFPQDMARLTAAAAASPHVVAFAPECVWAPERSEGWRGAFRRDRPEPYPGRGAPISGPILAVRREALIALGGFDERLGGSVLAGDIAYRLAQRGLRAARIEGWRAVIPFPTTRTGAEAWLRAAARERAYWRVLLGAPDAPGGTGAGGGFARLERQAYETASARLSLRRPQAAAAREHIRKGLLSVDALALGWADRPIATHLRAAASLPTAPAPKFSVVVPTYRRPDHLAALLALLAPQARALGAEIVVVDDGSEAGANAPVVAPYLDVVDYHRLEANQGRGAATNAGIARAKGQWIVFTDDDVRPPADWLSELARVIERFPELEVVGGACRPLGRARRGLVERFTIDRPNYVPRPYLARGSVKCMITACMAVRADVLAKVGGVDVNFVAGQDHNLTWRLRKAGARMHVTNDWWTAHDQAWTLQETLNRMYGYAYWHVRQARLSGEAIDYLYGPSETWSGLIAGLWDRLHWAIVDEGRSDRDAPTRAAYVVMDVLSHLAWSLGGVAGAKAARGVSQAAP